MQTTLDPDQLTQLIDAIWQLRTVLLWTMGIQLFRIFGDLFKPWDKSY